MRRALAAAALMAAGCALWAQSNGVFAPFVSRLKATVSGSSIVLTWRDSADIQAPLQVYRHTQEITEENLDEAQLIAEVPYGTGSFADYPPQAIPYFYAVIVSQPEGRRYAVLVPFRNKTLSPRSVDRVGSPEQLATRITGIEAAGTTDGIRVTFSSTRTNRTLLLYRSDEPIVDFQDLLDAPAVILEPGTEQFLDHPPAGADFYYAVLDEDLVKVGRIEVTPGENATTRPARRPLSEGAFAAPSAGPVIRARPLPDLVVSRAVYSGGAVAPALEVPRPRPLSPEAREALGELLAALPVEEPPPPAVTVLPVDRVEGGGSEEFMLRTIVQEDLVGLELQRAEHELVSFLRVRRSPDVEARARFYLGQVYILKARPREALMQFLRAADGYYVETRPWIDLALRRLAL